MAHCWSNIILIVRLILSGNSGDSLAVHRNMPFTTRDQDNDIYQTNCAIKFKGAIIMKKMRTAAKETNQWREKKSFKKAELSL